MTRAVTCCNFGGMRTTAVKITFDNKLWLEAQKIHPRETIDDVLTRLRDAKSKRKPVGREAR